MESRDHESGTELLLIGCMCGCLRQVICYMEERGWEQDDNRNGNGCHEGRIVCST